MTGAPLDEALARDVVDAVLRALSAPAPSRAR
jgi:hypothetical protein